MFNLTEILQKELHESDEKKGIVQSLLFDNLTRGCLLQTEQDIFEVDKIVPRWDDVTSSTRPWQNEQVTNHYDKRQFIHEIAVGQKIIDQNGINLGEVADVELTSKLAIKRLLVSDGKYLSRGEVVAVGDVVVAKAKLCKRAVADELRRERVLEKLNDSGKATQTNGESEDKSAHNQTSADNIEVAQKTDESVNLLTADTVENATTAEDETTTDTATTQENTPATNANSMQESTTTPQNGAQAIHLNTTATAERTGPIVAVSDKSIRRRYGDFSFLIGKSVDKTIVNFQGEVMIRQHETITRDILRQAKISGKLLELYLHIE